MHTQNSPHRRVFYSRVVELVQHRAVNADIAGSSPALGAMNLKLVYFPEWVIIDYLSNQGEALQATRNIEMLGALAMIKFCERQFGIKCLIGFHVQDKYEYVLPDRGSIMYEDFDVLVRKQIKTDSPIDFSVGKPDTKQRMDFQMKRFGKAENQKTNEDLIRFINKLSKEYGKTNCNLVILCEGCTYNPVEVSNGILTDNFPFDKIIILDIEDGEYIDYTGVWASTGETGISRLNLSSMEFEY